LLAAFELAPTSGEADAGRLDDEVGYRILVAMRQPTPAYDLVSSRGANPGRLRPATRSADAVTRPLSTVSGRTELGERDHQRPRPAAQRAKAEMLIEARSALIDRVYHDRANGQLLGGEDNALQRVAQQNRA
jgi:hypothetical protein